MKEDIDFSKKEDSYHCKPDDEECGMNKKRIQLTLHPEELEKLERVRKKRKYSRSSMMGVMIREYIEKK